MLAIEAFDINSVPAKDATTSIKRANSFWLGNICCRSLPINLDNPDWSNPFASAKPPPANNKIFQGKFVFISFHVIKYLNFFPNFFIN